MFRKYLESYFFAWSIKVDYQTAIKAIKNEREKFFCDTYNHFALQFKELATYELFMFRVSQKKMVNNIFEMIVVKLPETLDLNYATHLVYAFNDQVCYYFTIMANINFGFDLVVFEDEKMYKYSSFKNIADLETNIIKYLEVSRWKL